MGVGVAGALVDSGAQTSVIDRTAAARLGVEMGAPLPLLAYGVTGAPQVGRAAVTDVVLEGLSLPPAPPRGAGPAADRPGHGRGGWSW